MYQIASINIMISFEPISHLIPSSCEDVSPVSVYQVNWTIHHKSIWICKLIRVQILSFRLKGVRRLVCCRISESLKSKLSQRVPIWPNKDPAHGVVVANVSV